MYPSSIILSPLLFFSLPLPSSCCLPLYLSPFLVSIFIICLKLFFKVTFKTSHDTWAYVQNWLRANRERFGWTWFSGCWPSRCNDHEGRALCIIMRFTEDLIIYLSSLFIHVFVIICIVYLFIFFVIYSFLLVGFCRVSLFSIFFSFYIFFCIFKIKDFRKKTLKPHLKL